MKPWMTLTALAAGLGAMTGAAALLAPSEAGTSAQAAWLPSFEAARVAAREAGKPIFLVFR